MQSKKVELKNISEKPFSLRDKINRAKINIEKIRRKRKVKHAFYALGSIALGFGSAGGGIWTLISLIKSIDAGEKKRVLQYYNDAEKKWAGSIYNSALLKSINKTCQEIAPLQFNIQSERCKIKLIDPNDDVYDHCFSKDNPLVLDEDCKQMFGEFSTYATCATIFNKELSGDSFNKTFNIDCKKLPESEIFVQYVGIALLFIFACYLLFIWPCFKYAKKDDFKNDELPDNGQGDLKEVESKIKGLSFGNKNLMEINDLLSNIQMKFQKIDAPKHEFLSQFYMRDQEEGCIIKKENFQPKEILHKIFFFAELMATPPADIKQDVKENDIYEYNGYDNSLIIRK